MKILRTTDERFQNLPGYGFAPHYVESDGVRIHYVDEGPRELGVKGGAEPNPCIHRTEASCV